MTLLLTGSDMSVINLGQLFLFRNRPQRTRPKFYVLVGYATRITCADINATILSNAMGNAWLLHFEFLCNFAGIVLPNVNHNSKLYSSRFVRFLSTLISKEQFRILLFYQFPLRKLYMSG